MTRQGYRPRSLRVQHWDDEMHSLTYEMLTAHSRDLKAKTQVIDLLVESVEKLTELVINHINPKY